MHIKQSRREGGSGPCPCFIQASNCWMLSDIWNLTILRFGWLEYICAAVSWESCVCQGLKTSNDDVIIKGHLIRREVGQLSAAVLYYDNTQILNSFLQNMSWDSWVITWSYDNTQLFNSLAVRFIFSEAVEIVSRNTLSSRLNVRRSASGEAIEPIYTLVCHMVKQCLKANKHMTLIWYNN